MTDDDSQISSILSFASGLRVINLSDGTALELSDADVEMLTGAFPGECEACGYDPSKDTLEDEEEEEES